ncbi:hypothetical protein Sango_0121000 [Sesamum angolense]|uniref:NAD(P)-binding domain-containing protein n=1 Tax=Sesamum angolense TaxID=2727404 RepID=A0AAE2C6H9_9LAMI|nr:hypothetical protein Sango_0121000 [Sesamum angolense]
MSNPESESVLGSTGNSTRWTRREYILSGLRGGSSVATDPVTQQSIDLAHFQLEEFHSSPRIINDWTRESADKRTNFGGNRNFHFQQLNSSKFPWRVRLQLSLSSTLRPCTATGLSRISDHVPVSKSGGPKLRKWYGAPDLLPKDGNELEEDEAAEEDEVRDAVLVTDGDNEIGQMIILSLIVKRVRVKTLVKDKRVAMEAFGTYVESMAGDTKDTAFLKKALRGVRAVICPTEGCLYNIESWKGIQHVILLSQLSVYRDSTGIQAVMNSNARKLAEQDENVVKSSGVPYSIIRTGLLKNTPGGQQGFCFEEYFKILCALISMLFLVKIGSAAKGSLSKEDAAFICVKALDSVPEKGLIFEVVNGAEKVSDWKKCFATLVDGSLE